MILHLSPTLVSHSGCIGPHEFALVSHLIPTCLPHLSPTLVALGRMSLHLSPLVFRTCLPLWVPWAASFYTCLPLVPHTLVSLGCMSLHLSSICLPHLSPTLGALGPHEFTNVSQLSPHLSPTLGALGRMSLHLSSHTCFPHLSRTLGWVPWAA